MVAILDPEVVVVRSIFSLNARLADGVRAQLKHALVDCPVVRPGTPGDEGRWMAAQGAALRASDLYVRPRVEARCEQDDVASVSAVRSLDG
jgi:hypothetical protein